jgi:hypothetical protein
MHGAVLKGTWRHGTDLTSAVMHGAIFEQAHLGGTTFYRTELQGALFRDASFEGALFVEAQLQGVEMLQSEWVKGRPRRAGALRDSIVSDSLLWRAGSMRCDFTHVVSPNFAPIIQITYSDDGKSKRIPATEGEISNFIKRSLEDVSEKSNAEVNFKVKLRADLVSRLSLPPSDASAPIERAWRNCVTESEARTLNGDFQTFAENIVEYACKLPNMDPFASAYATKGNRGALNMWASELEKVPVGRLVATSLLDEQKCRSAKTLTDHTKLLLRYVINPGE